MDWDEVGGPGALESPGEEFSAPLPMAEGWSGHSSAAEANVEGFSALPSAEEAPELYEAAAPETGERPTDVAASIASDLKTIRLGAPRPVLAPLPLKPLAPVDLRSELSKPVGVKEALKSLQWTDVVPFGPLLGGFREERQALAAAERLSKGFYASDYERLLDEYFLTDYLSNRELMRSRPRTFFGAVAEILARMPAYMLELYAASGIAARARLAVLQRIAPQETAKLVAEIGKRPLLQRVINPAAKDALVRASLLREVYGRAIRDPQFFTRFQRGVSLALAEIPRTLVALSPRAIEEALGDAIDRAVEFDLSTRRVALIEPPNVFRELPAAFLSQYIEAISENTGVIFDDAVAAVVKRVGLDKAATALAARLPRMIGRGLAAIKERKLFAAALDAWRQVAGSFLLSSPGGEYFEERVAMLAHAVFGTDRSPDDRTPLGVRVADALLFEARDPKLAAAMVSAFSVLPVGGALLTAFRGVADAQTRTRLEKAVELRLQRGGLPSLVPTSTLHDVASLLVDEILRTSPVSWETIGSSVHRLLFPKMPHAPVYLKDSPPDLVMALLGYDSAREVETWINELRAEYIRETSATDDPKTIAAKREELVQRTFNAILESGQFDVVGTEETAEALRRGLRSGLLGVGVPVTIETPVGMQAYVRPMRLEDAMAGAVGRSVISVPGQYGAVAALYPLTRDPQEGLGFRLDQNATVRSLVDALKVLSPGASTEELERIIRSRVSFITDLSSSDWVDRLKENGVWLSIPSSLTATGTSTAASAMGLPEQRLAFREAAKQILRQGTPLETPQMEAALRALEELLRVSGASELYMVPGAPIIRRRIQGTSGTTLEYDEIAPVLFYDQDDGRRVLFVSGSVSPLELVHDAFESAMLTPQTPDEELLEFTTRVRRSLYGFLTALRRTEAAAAYKEREMARTSAAPSLDELSAPGAVRLLTALIDRVAPRKRLGGEDIIVPVRSRREAMEVLHWSAVLFTALAGLRGHPFDYRADRRGVLTEAAVREYFVRRGLEQSISLVSSFEVTRASTYLRHLFKEMMSQKKHGLLEMPRAFSSLLRDLRVLDEKIRSPRWKIFHEQARKRASDFLAPRDIVALGRAGVASLLWAGVYRVDDMDLAREVADAGIVESLNELSLLPTRRGFTALAPEGEVPPQVISWIKELNAGVFFPKEGLRVFGSIDPRRLQLARAAEWVFQALTRIASMRLGSPEEARRKHPPSIAARLLVGEPVGEPETDALRSVVAVGRAAEAALAAVSRGLVGESISESRLRDLQGVPPPTQEKIARLLLNELAPRLVEASDTTLTFVVVLPEAFQATGAGVPDMLRIRIQLTDEIKLEELRKTRPDLFEGIEAGLAIGSGFADIFVDVLDLKAVSSAHANEHNDFIPAVSPASKHSIMWGAQLYSYARALFSLWGQAQTDYFRRAQKLHQSLAEVSDAEARFQLTWQALLSAPFRLKPGRLLVVPMGFRDITNASTAEPEFFYNLVNVTKALTPEALQKLEEIVGAPMPQIPEPFVQAFALSPEPTVTSIAYGQPLTVVRLVVEPSAKAKAAEPPAQAKPSEKAKEPTKPGASEKAPIPVDQITDDTRFADLFRGRSLDEVLTALREFHKQKMKSQLGWIQELANQLAAEEEKKKKAEETEAGAAPSAADEAAAGATEPMVFKSIAEFYAAVKAGKVKLEGLGPKGEPPPPPPEAPEVTESTVIDAEAEDVETTISRIKTVIPEGLSPEFERRLRERLAASKQTKQTETPPTEVQPPETLPPEAQGPEAQGPEAQGPEAPGGIEHFRHGSVVFGEVYQGQLRIYRSDKTREAWQEFCTEYGLQEAQNAGMYTLLVQTHELVAHGYRLLSPSEQMELVEQVRLLSAQVEEVVQANPDSAFARYIRRREMDLTPEAKASPEVSAAERLGFAVEAMLLFPGSLDRALASAWRRGAQAIFERTMSTILTAKGPLSLLSPLVGRFLRSGLLRGEPVLRVAIVAYVTALQRVLRGWHALDRRLDALLRKDKAGGQLPVETVLAPLTRIRPGVREVSFALVKEDFGTLYRVESKPGHFPVRIHVSLPRLAVWIQETRPTWRMRGPLGGAHVYDAVAIALGVIARYERARALEWKEHRREPSPLTIALHLRSFFNAVIAPRAISVASALNVVVDLGVPVLVARELESMDPDISTMKHLDQFLEKLFSPEEHEETTDTAGGETDDEMDEGDASVEQTTQDDEGAKEEWASQIRMTILAGTVLGQFGLDSEQEPAVAALARYILDRDPQLEQMKPLLTELIDRYEKADPFASLEEIHERLANTTDDAGLSAFVLFVGPVASEVYQRVYGPTAILTEAHLRYLFGLYSNKRPVFLYTMIGKGETATLRAQELAPTDAIAMMIARGIRSRYSNVVALAHAVAAIREAQRAYEAAAQQRQPWLVQRTRYRQWAITVADALGIPPIYTLALADAGRPTPGTVRTARIGTALLSSLTQALMTALQSAVAFLQQPDRTTSDALVVSPIQFVTQALLAPDSSGISVAQMIALRTHIVASSPGYRDLMSSVLTPREIDLAISIYGVPRVVEHPSRRGTYLRPSVGTRAFDHAMDRESLPYHLAMVYGEHFTDRSIGDMLNRDPEAVLPLFANIFYHSDLAFTFERQGPEAPSVPAREGGPIVRGPEAGRRAMILPAAFGERFSSSYVIVAPRYETIADLLKSPEGQFVWQRVFEVAQRLRSRLEPFYKKLSPAAQKKVDLTTYVNRIMDALLVSPAYLTHLASAESAGSKAPDLFDAHLRVHYAAILLANFPDFEVFFAKMQYTPSSQDPDQQIAEFEKAVYLATRDARDKRREKRSALITTPGAPVNYWERPIWNDVVAEDLTMDRIWEVSTPQEREAIRQALHLPGDDAEAVAKLKKIEMTDGVSLFIRGTKEFIAKVNPAVFHDRKFILGAKTLYVGVYEKPTEEGKPPVKRTEIRKHLMYNLETLASAVGGFFAQMWSKVQLLQALGVELPDSISFASTAKVTSGTPIQLIKEVRRLADGTKAFEFNFSKVIDPENWLSLKSEYWKFLFDPTSEAEDYLGRLPVQMAGRIAAAPVNAPVAGELMAKATPVSPLLDPDTFDQIMQAALPEQLKEELAVCDPITNLKKARQLLAYTKSLSLFQSEYSSPDAASRSTLRVKGLNLPATLAGTGEYQSLRTREILHDATATLRREWGIPISKYPATVRLPWVRQAQVPGRRGLVAWDTSTQTTPANALLHTLKSIFLSDQAFSHLDLLWVKPEHSDTIVSDYAITLQNLRRLLTHFNPQRDWDTLGQIVQLHEFYYDADKKRVLVPGSPEYVVRGPLIGEMMGFWARNGQLVDPEVIGGAIIIPDTHRKANDSDFDADALARVAAFSPSLNDAVKAAVLYAESKAETGATPFSEGLGAQMTLLLRMAVNEEQDVPLAIHRGWPLDIESPELFRHVPPQVYQLETLPPSFSFLDLKVRARTATIVGTGMGVAALSNRILTLLHASEHDVPDETLWTVTFPANPQEPEKSEQIHLTFGNLDAFLKRNPDYERDDLMYARVLATIAQTVVDASPNGFMASMGMTDRDRISALMCALAVSPEVKAFPRSMSPDAREALAYERVAKIMRMITLSTHAATETAQNVLLGFQSRAPFQYALWPYAGRGVASMTPYEFGENVLRRVRNLSFDVLGFTDVLHEGPNTVSGSVVQEAQLSLPNLTGGIHQFQPRAKGRKLPLALLSNIGREMLPVLNRSEPLLLSYPGSPLGRSVIATLTLLSKGVSRFLTAPQRKALGLVLDDRLTSTGLVVSLLRLLLEHPDCPQEFRVTGTPEQVDDAIKQLLLDPIRFAQLARMALESAHRRGILPWLILGGSPIPLVTANFYRVSPAIPERIDFSLISALKFDTFGVPVAPYRIHGLTKVSGKNISEIKSAVIKNLVPWLPRLFSRSTAVGTLAHHDIERDAHKLTDFELLALAAYGAYRYGTTPSAKADGGYTFLLKNVLVERFGSHLMHSLLGWSAPMFEEQITSDLERNVAWWAVSDVLAALPNRPRIRALLFRGPFGVLGALTAATKTGTLRPFSLPADVNYDMLNAAIAFSSIPDFLSQSAARDDQQGHDDSDAPNATPPVGAFALPLLDRLPVVLKPVLTDQTSDYVLELWRRVQIETQKLRDLSRAWSIRLFGLQIGDRRLIPIGKETTYAAKLLRQAVTMVADWVQFRRMTKGEDEKDPLDTIQAPEIRSVRVGSVDPRNRKLVTVKMENQEMILLRPNRYDTSLLEPVYEFRDSKTVGEILDQVEKEFGYRITEEDIKAAVREVFRAGEDQAKLLRELTDSTFQDFNFTLPQAGLTSFGYLARAVNIRQTRKLQAAGFRILHNLRQRAGVMTGLISTQKRLKQEDIIKLGQLVTRLSRQMKKAIEEMDIEDLTPEEMMSLLPKIEKEQVPLNDAAKSDSTFFAGPAVEPSDAAAIAMPYETNRRVRWVPRLTARRPAAQEATGFMYARAHPTIAAGLSAGVVYKTLDVAWMVRMWGDEVSRTAAAKLILTALATLTDATGAPAAIVIRHLAALTGRLARPGREPLSRNAANIMLRNFADWLNDPGRRYSLAERRQEAPFFVPSALSSPWAQIASWFLRHERAITLEFERAGYMKIDLSRAGFIQEGHTIREIWVRSPTAYKLMMLLFGHGVEDELGPTLTRLSKLLMKFNQLTKELQVSFSLFHVVAELESWISAWGLRDLIRGTWLWHPKYGIWKLYNLYKRTRLDPATPDIPLEFRSMIPDPMTGIDWNAPDRPLYKVLVAIDRWFKHLSVFGWVFRAPLQVFKAAYRVQNAFLWQFLVPTLKLQTALRLDEETEDLPEFADWDPSIRRLAIAQRVNDIFGGQEPGYLLWMTPGWRDTLQMLLFAVDWTVSALRQAGVHTFLEEIFGRPTIISSIEPKTEWGRNFFRSYWAVFILFNLFLLPLLLQILIHWFNRLLPEDAQDPHHKLLMMDNEPGRENYIDITPLYSALERLPLVGRTLSRGRGLTGQRRVYIRAGKQAYENLRLITPLRYLGVKSSPAIKILYEQITGTSIEGWPMPWTDASSASGIGAPFGGLLGGADYARGDFWAGRAGAALKYFIPMTFHSFLARDLADFRPLSVAMPTTLGISRTRAEKYLIDIFMAYADKGLWRGIVESDIRRRNLFGLAFNVAVALHVNGYDAKEIFEAARSKAASHYRRLFLQALDHQDISKMKEYAAKLQRLATTPDDLIRRVEEATGLANRLTLEQRRALLRLWRESAPDSPSAS